MQHKKDTEQLGLKHTEAHARARTQMAAPAGQRTRGGEERTDGGQAVDTAFHSAGGKVCPPPAREKHSHRTQTAQSVPLL